MSALRLTSLRVVSADSSDKSSASASSLSDGRTNETAATSNELQHDEPAPLPSSLTGGPAIQTSTINLPLELPSAPNELVDVDLSRLIVDEEYEGYPLGLVISKLQSMGHSLHAAATSTVLHIPKTPALPNHLACTLPLDAVPPSHVLAISAADSPRTLLVPVHGILFAARCSTLSILSSAPARQPPHPALPPPLSESSESATLPVVQLSLPSCAAFPLLQSYIYLASPQHLLASLLPPTPPSPNPRSNLASLLNPTALTLSQSLSLLGQDLLLQRVGLVHGLWQTAVALGVADEALWTTMKLAWRILVGALCLIERQKKASATDMKRARQVTV